MESPHIREGTPYVGVFLLGRNLMTSWNRVEFLIRRICVGRFISSFDFMFFYFISMACGPKQQQF